MKLSDMIEKKLAEQTPSMGQQRAARAMKQPGVSAKFRVFSSNFAQMNFDLKVELFTTEN